MRILISAMARLNCKSLLGLLIYSDKINSPARVFPNIGAIKSSHTPTILIQRIRQKSELT